MKLFGFEITRSRKSAGISINTLISRLEAIYATASGISVTPENAMQSPTVAAIVNGIARRISTLPVQVLQKGMSDGREFKEVLPNHPVARLLREPNFHQDRVTFWLDAASWLVRYGNFYALKARGETGPIRFLQPYNPGHVKLEQDTQTLILTYRVNMADGSQREYPASDMMHARGPSRDGIVGDSPVMDVREAIALELAAERMGAAVFGNSAAPSVIFNYAQGFQGHKTEEERQKFIEDYQAAYSGSRMHRAMILPKGLEISQALGIDNEKAQFLATRQYQRTVIAGAFGVPPHLVGDLSSGKFNNVEQQSLDFILNVVLPNARIFEAAMERSLLTVQDRRNGVIIRFNLDAALRADFKTQQEGLNIQRQAGVINANEWRERIGLNPIGEEDGGEEYWRKGPSGQSAEPPGGAPAADNPDPAADPSGDDPDEVEEENDD